MEDEIDLRVYIKTLIRHWRLIAVATLLAGVVALAVSFASPSKYKATAVLLIPRPFYQIQVSTRDPEPDGYWRQQLLTGKAASDLATSDALLRGVLLEVGDESPARCTQSVIASSNAQSRGLAVIRLSST